MSFPLPENAAVNEFVMTIGERRIRGIIRERERPSRSTEKRSSQGYVASLLTQERPNIFTQSVANIEPGRHIDVNIHYFHTLAFRRRLVRVRVPDGRRPALQSAWFDERRRRAAARRQRARPGHQPCSTCARASAAATTISLHVDLHAGVDIEEIACPTHQVDCSRAPPAHATVALRPEDPIPNKDFVLRYRVAGDRIKSGLLDGARRTRRVLFTDALSARGTSPRAAAAGGDCLRARLLRQHERQAHRAGQGRHRRGLDWLQPGDSFQIIDFSMTAGQLGRQPLEATPQNIERARRFLAISTPKGAR